MPLDPEIHDRSLFSCGVSVLDVFLREKARKESANNLNTTFVLTLADRPSEIVGYYSLSSKQIAIGDLPQKMTKRLPRYDHLGVTLLGRFAIADKYQRSKAPGQGLGALLLNDVKLRAWKASQHVGSFAIVVDVLVGEKGDPTPFCLKYDFAPFPNDSSKLYLPMSTIERTLKSAELIT